MIELVGADAGCERVAIRYERIFLWRRRLLPLETVARVVPEQRAVLLTLDRQLLDRLDLPGDEMEGTRGPSAEGVRPRSDWLERIERYNAGGQGERAELKRGPDAGREPPPTERRQEPTAPAHTDGRSLGLRAHEQPPAERHLLFVPTTDGYLLVEREGPPPPLSGEVEAPELPGLFVVAKLAPSPLPNDRRPCAYLERPE